MDKILVVDDEKGVCHSFKKILGRRGYTVVTAGDGLEAIEKAGRENPSLVIMDITMPKLDGLETLQRLKSIDPDVHIIIMTAHSTSEKAIGAMKHGAYDYLTKPFDNEEMISLVEKALAARNIPPSLTREEIVDDRGGRIIGRTPQMLDIFKKIGQVSATDVTLLIRGETGTGKEKIARAIYHHSTRADKPFLPINCAAIPENLLESELFGHERGAFTGAEGRKTGKFEQCDRGTMFLDEIGDMPLHLQSKLLRVLEDGTFQRLGGKEMIKTDVRILAATNKDIDTQVRSGEFREDLYWRLNVVTIHLPPLRERLGDLEDFVHHFITRFNAQLGKRIRGIEPELMKAFSSYHWPGNVRELQGVVQRGMVLCQKAYLSFDDCEWPPEKGHQEGSAADTERLLSDAARFYLRQGSANIYRDAVSSFEQHLVKQALELHDNNQVLAAKFLGISRNTLREKIDRHPQKDVPEK
ncbi:MAG: sigma-54-dependent Fis family transcriptional regulator [Nitrospiraceae bacterium]|nr:MAG: sigma-54-dependent Fis family transcriptional regulator [Nitrospiraceae bacterium]